MPAAGADRTGGGRMRSSIHRRRRRAADDCAIDRGKVKEPRSVAHSRGATRQRGPGSSRWPSSRSRPASAGTGRGCRQRCTPPLGLAGGDPEPSASTTPGTSQGQRRPSGVAGVRAEGRRAVAAAHRVGRPLARGDHPIDQLRWEGPGQHSNRDPIRQMRQHRRPGLAGAWHPSVITSGRRTLPDTPTT